MELVERNAPYQVALAVGGTAAGVIVMLGGPAVFLAVSLTLIGVTVAWLASDSVRDARSGTPYSGPVSTVRVVPSTGSARVSRRS